MDELARDYKMQGVTMMGLDKYEDAKELFRKSLNIEESADVYMDLGNACASMGDYNDAIDAFSKALLLEPDNGEILFNIGSVYLLQERLKKCIEYYNKAEAAGFTHVRLYINMAAIYKALGDRQMELRNYTKAIDKNPLMGELYVKKVMLFIEMDRYAEALETLDDMRKLFPDAFEGYDLAARIYAGQGKHEEAIDILDEGIKKFPEDINLRISKINTLIEIKEVDQAEEILKEVKENAYADDFRRVIMMEEVSIASIRNQPEKMYDLLVDIIKTEEKDDCDEESRYMLMMTSILLERFDKALEMAVVLENQPSKSSFVVSAIYYKGEILKKLNREEESNAQFKKATKQLRLISMSHRTFYECYIYRALAHKQLKEYDKAIEMGEYIVNLQSERGDGHMILADIYQEMGEEEKSQEQFLLAQGKESNFIRRE